MKRKLAILTLVAVLIGQSLLLTGCWSKKEIDDFAIVLGSSTDITTENGIDKYVLLTSVVRPPSQGKPGPSAPAEIFLKGKGPSFQEALMGSMKELPRHTFFGQILFNIFGERTAQEKTAQLMEGLLRYSQDRPLSSLYVTKGEASKILQALPTSYSILSFQIKKQEETALRAGVACGVSFEQFGEWLLSPDRDAVLPEIETVSRGKDETVPESIIVQGFGVFRGTKLVGWLNTEEARGYLLITKKISAGQIPIPFTMDGKSMVYWLSGTKSKITSCMTDGTPSFKITIQTKGVIYDTNNYDVSAEEIKPLEQAVGEEIRLLPLKTIAKAKEYEADFLGCMENLHRYHLSAWQEIAPNWRESFRNADIEVEVQAKILSAGLVSQSLQIKE